MTTTDRATTPQSAMNQLGGPPVTFELVDYADERAVALRTRMDLEIGPRYATRDTAGNPEDIRKALLIDPATIRATVLALDSTGTPVAHAVLREHHGDWEVKRVMVGADQRGRGVGRALMTELERIASAAGAPRLILQTGDRQPDAVALYTRLGYTPIATYEPYLSAIPFSLCFEKPLTTLDPDTTAR